MILKLWPRVCPEHKRLTSGHVSAQEDEKTRDKLGWLSFSKHAGMKLLPGFNSIAATVEHVKGAIGTGLAVKDFAVLIRRLTVLDTTPAEVEKCSLRCWCRHVVMHCDWLPICTV